MRPARHGQQPAGRRIFAVHERQGGVQVPLGDPPAGRPARGNAEQPQAGFRLRSMTTPNGAVVHQHRLDRLREGLDGPPRQTVNHAVQFIVGGARNHLARRGGGRRFQCHFQAMREAPQSADRSDQPPWRRPTRWRQGPAAHAADTIGPAPDGRGHRPSAARPVSPITILQVAANQVHVGRLHANLAVGQIDDVDAVLLADPPLDGLTIAEQENLLVGRRRNRLGARQQRGREHRGPQEQRQFA